MALEPVFLTTRLWCTVFFCFCKPHTTTVMFSRSDLSISLIPMLNWIYMCSVTSRHLTFPKLLVRGNIIEHLTPLSPRSLGNAHLLIPAHSHYRFDSSLSWVPGLAAMPERLLADPTIFDLGLQCHSHKLSQELTFPTVLKLQAPPRI